MNINQPIAHPECIDDACGRLANTLYLDSTMRDGLPNREFMLSTPAHRMLRAIYGSSWRVCWWAFKLACKHSFNNAMPQWWHEVRYRLAYGCWAKDDIAAYDKDGD